MIFVRREKALYHLDRQKVQGGKDVRAVRMVKYVYENMMTSKGNVRWKMEYIEKLMKKKRKKKKRERMLDKESVNNEM